MGEPWPRPVATQTATGSKMLEKGGGKMQQVCVCVCGFARMDSRNLITSAAWHAAHLAGKFGYLGRANKTCFVQGKRAHLRRRDLLVSGPRLLLHWALLPAHFSSAVPGQQRRVHVVSRNTSGSCRKAPCFHRPALRTAKQLFLFSPFFLPSSFGAGRDREPHPGLLAKSILNTCSVFDDDVDQLDHPATPWHKKTSHTWHLLYLSTESMHCLQSV